MPAPHDFTFSPDAAWIWSADAKRPYNNIVLFRRSFDVDGDATARLLITADSRYEVYVNGQWLGFGPPRAWPSPWPVDAYDLTGLLKLGRNTIAVIVQHWGLSTFQYLHGEPGLLAEVQIADAGGSRRIATDPQWRCTPSAAHGWPVPRASCMQGWEEQFDARELAADWNLPTFDDHAWPSAQSQCLAGEGKHAAFQLRDIPMLTCDRTPPVRVMAVESVRPATHVWSLHPRDLLNSEDKSANVARGKMLLATYLISDRPQRIEFHLPHHRPPTQWKLNGKLLTFDDLSLQQTDTGVAHAQLKAGPNLLLCRMPEMEHYWWASLSARVESPIRLAATPESASSPTAWTAFGPFGSDADRKGAVGGIDPHGVDALHFLPEATTDRFEEIWSNGQPHGADFAAVFARPLTPDMVATDDVYVRCASERIVPGSTPTVEHANALMADSPEWTTVYPSATADTRFLLDFGEEVIGFHEIEVDAPAGTVLDIHNFEFIQPDGRFNLAEGMNNSFRHVCREGWQRYRTLMRRGFRYTWLSIRNASGPVRIRSVRVLTSTYPQVRHGSFACSHPLLNQIWEVGARSVECCSEDTYTDCPSYEQTFWVGDARNEAMVDLIINGDPRLSAHSLRLAGQSLDRSPIVESQVPSGWQNVLPAWSFLWMRWTQEHFEFTGDLAFAGEMLGLIERNVAGVEQHVNADRLFQMRAWNMFDWAAMDTPPDGIVTHLNCLAVLALRQVATMADAADRTDLSTRWTALADRIASSTNRILWDDQRQAYVDCIRADGTHSPVFSQQTQTAAYIAGVATGDRAVRCGQIMHEAPEGFVTAGSPFFMFFLLEGLVREGKIDQLIQQIINYWGPQVEAGATTFWEMYTRDQARMTRSHCHGWSAGPTYFLTQHVLGLSPAGPGYSRLRVAPRPGHVRWARGTVPTPHGTVSCSWQADAHGTFVRVEAPYELSIDVPVTASQRVEMIRGVAASQSAGTVTLRGASIQFRITSADDAPASGDRP